MNTEEQEFDVKEALRSGDWQGIHAKLNELKDFLAHGALPDRATTDRILQERARELACEYQDLENDEELLSVIHFSLADEEYGIESTYVKEVYPLVDLITLPCTPPFVLGIVNVRGQIMSVIDLKIFFELPASDISQLSKVIILHDGDMEFGIVADAIIGTRGIAVEELQHSLPTLSERRAEYLKGVTNETLIILDALKIINDEQLIVHEEV